MPDIPARAPSTACHYAAYLQARAHATPEISVDGNRAGFIGAQSGPDYPPRLLDEFLGARDADGEQISTGRYLVLHQQHPLRLAAGRQAARPWSRRRSHPAGSIQLTRGRWQAAIPAAG